jgi:hypothetical protein
MHKLVRTFETVQLLKDLSDVSPTHLLKGSVSATSCSVELCMLLLDLLPLV